jgi:hypothetical protein
MPFSSFLKYSPLLLLLFISSAGSAQKLKAEVITYQAVVTPSKKVDLKREYEFRGTVKWYEQDGTLRTQPFNSGGTHNGYASAAAGQLGRIGGFKTKKAGFFETSDSSRCSIKATYEPLEVTGKKVNRNAKWPGTTTGQRALSYDMSFRLPRTFEFFDDNGVRLMHVNQLTDEKQTYVFNFPRDFKWGQNQLHPTGYLNMADLDLAFADKIAAFQGQVHQMILTDCSKRMKNKVQLLYGETRIPMTLLYYWIKDKKNPKATELSLALDKLKQIRAIIKGHRKAKNVMNWHDAISKKLLAEVADIYMEALAAYENGERGLLQTEKEYITFSINLAQVLFLQTNFEEATQKVEAINTRLKALGPPPKQRDPNDPNPPPPPREPLSQQEYDGARELDFSATDVGHYEVFLKAFKNYVPRYELGKTHYEWE